MEYLAQSTPNRPNRGARRSPPKPGSRRPSAQVDSAHQAGAVWDAFVAHTWAQAHCFMWAAWGGIGGNAHSIPPAQVLHAVLSFLKNLAI